MTGPTFGTCWYARVGQKNLLIGQEIFADIKLNFNHDQCSVTNFFAFLGKFRDIVKLYNVWVFLFYLKTLPCQCQSDKLRIDISAWYC